MDAAEARWAWRRYGPSGRGPQSTGRPAALAVVQAIEAEGGSFLFVPETERHRLRERKPEEDRGRREGVVDLRGPATREAADRRGGERILAAARRKEADRGGMAPCFVEAGERAGDAVLRQGEGGRHGLLLLLREEHREREIV
ncbi:hypothetical protein VPH35_081770 [Triticum aestivum]